MIGALLYLIGDFYKDWFAKTMPRHQILQLPIALLLGLLLGAVSYTYLKLTFIPRIAGLIFVMGSLAFWMLPLSVDLAVIYPLFNWVMIVNMLIAGVLWYYSLKNAALEVKVVFYALLTSMLIGIGLVLSNFDILLCSAFTIQQQNETGNYMIGIGVFILLFTYFTFLREAGKKRE